MAIVKILKLSFTPEGQDDPVKYERLGLIGVIGGETHTLEIKLEPAELKLAKILLSSTEGVLSSEVRPATADEARSMKIDVKDDTDKKLDDFFES